MAFYIFFVFLLKGLQGTLLETKRTSVCSLQNLGRGMCPWSLLQGELPRLIHPPKSWRDFYKNEKILQDLKDLARKESIVIFFIWNLALNLVGWFLNFGPNSYNKSFLQVFWISMKLDCTIQINSLRTAIAFWAHIIKKGRNLQRKLNFQALSRLSFTFCLKHLATHHKYWES